MVITFVCDVLGQENNGTTIATMNVIRSLRSKGHEVRIVCPDQDKIGQPGYYVVPAINFGIFSHYVASNGVCPASGKDLGPLKEALEGCDIVHFNFCGMLSGKACDYAHSLGIPCTASLHTQAENFTNHLKLENFYPANKLVYTWLYRSLFSKVDAIHYPSKFIHDLFEKVNHFHSKSYVISNGIQKAFQREAVERPAEYKDKFIIKLRKEAKKWCVNPPVFGFHSREEMVKILNYADLYCHVGTVDIEPVSFLEAISVGICPVLTDSPRSAVSGFALDQRNVYDHRSSKDLAKHIDYWFEHPIERKQNADSYLGYADKFDFQRSMDAMEKMFLETIDEYRHNHQEALELKEKEA